MLARIAIDGLGRVGRNQLRLLSSTRTGLELVAVNDPRPPRELSRLLQADADGPRGRVRHDDRHLFVNGHAVPVLAEADRTRLPWSELGVDIVIDAGGAADAETARAHLQAGARKVIMSAPASGDDGTFVLGVNTCDYDPGRHHVVSSASCTTNCLAPVAKVLDDAFGIESALMTTIHAATADPERADVPHADPCPERSDSERIASAATSAGRAVAQVLPALAGRLDGVALHVPAFNGAITHLTVTTARPVDIESVTAAYRTAAEGPLRGVLRCADDEIGTADSVIDTHSAILDASLIRAADHQVKISTWYDDEWGYSHRLVELTRFIAERLPRP